LCKNFAGVELYGNHFESDIIGNEVGKYKSDYINIPSIIISILFS